MSISRIAAVPDPDTEAMAILEGVWSRVSPSVVPVDPVRIAGELGVEVFDAELAPNVSGAIVKKPGDDPQILLNRADHPNRQRFTAAHELGHYVHRAEDEPEGYEYIDFRGPLAGEGSDPKERFANAFAASLLMPEAEVRTRAKRARSIVELAYEFRVSQEAMTLRLKNLDVDVT